MAQAIPDQRPLEPCRRCDFGSLAELDQALSRFLICGPVSSHIRRESAPRATARISKLGNRLRLPSANRTTAIGCFPTAHSSFIITSIVHKCRESIRISRTNPTSLSGVLSFRLAALISATFETSDLICSMLPSRCFTQLPVLRREERFFVTTGSGLSAKIPLNRFLAASTSGSVESVTSL